MFDKHTHHPVPDGTIDRIEKMMVETARKEAGAVASKIVAADKMDRPSPSTSACDMASVLGNTRTPARLEPFHCEVKHAMKHQKMTEKEAERHVRKSLLSDAACSITDEMTRNFAFALISIL